MHFFPYANLQKLEKSVKTAESRRKNKALHRLQKMLGMISPFLNTPKFSIYGIKYKFWISSLSMHAKALCLVT